MNIKKQSITFTALALLLVALLAQPACVALASSRPKPALASPVTIYDDSLSPAWQDWSWDATRNLSNTSPVQSGSRSISLTFTKGWAALYLHPKKAQSTTGYSHLEFSLHGGAAGGQRLNVVVNKDAGAAVAVTAAAGAWTKFSIPLADLGQPSTISDLFFQDSTGAVLPKFYIDSIALVDRAAPTAAPTLAATTAVPTPTQAAPTAAPTLAPTQPAQQPTIQPTQPPAQTTADLYTDSLAQGWQDWSWGVTRALNNASPVQSGGASISLTYTSAWSALYLHSDTPLSTVGYSHLRFWIHGGSSGGQLLKVVANKNASAAVTVTAPANTWNQVLVPLANLGSPASLSDLFWQDSTGASQATFYLDGIALVATGAPAPTPTSAAGLTLRVDAAAGQRPISPDIYGMNFAPEVLAAELRLPVRRFGGNATTRYNWQNDTSNRASDWYFENVPNSNGSPGALPNGSASDQFVEQDRRTGTRTLMTVPMIGWTPKSRAYACGFSVSKYGAQQAVDPYRADCGNGVRGDGSEITGNDPRDTSLAVGPSFVTDFVRHLVSRYGAAASGGVAYYNLDNEPMLWNSTHRDVHPDPVSYDELRDRTYQYGAAVKAADPTARTLGPALWGWTAYFYSALDVSQGGDYWNNPLDREAHGNLPVVEWYLQQMRAYEQAHGTRILDYLDLHYYPQSGVALRAAGDAATQSKRLRSTRSLWDAAYTDESWINTPVRLIPRMREWVEKNYPGTRLAISEYNFGGLESLNGALAQADVLGIFGREGLDLATLWDPPQASQPGAYAFRMYRNYDGRGGSFGDTSVQAVSSDQSALAIYAARRGDGALTIMVINKTGASQTAAVSVANFDGAAQAQAYRYSSANLSAVVRQPDLSQSAGQINASFPASSITLIVLPRR